MDFRDESDDGEEANITPPNLVDYSKNIEGELLPPKSRDRYDRVYRSFMQWKKDEKATSNSERTILLYFGYLFHEKRMKPTTLWSYHSMLQTTLSIKDNEDISKYAKVTAFLKRQSDGYEPTRAKSFSKEEMEKFLKDEFLDVKVS